MSGPRTAAMTQRDSRGGWGGGAMCRSIKGQVHCFHTLLPAAEVTFSAALLSVSRATFMKLDRGRERTHHILATSSSVVRAHALCTVIGWGSFNLHFNLQTQIKEIWRKIKPTETKSKHFHWNRINQMMLNSLNWDLQLLSRPITPLLTACC